MKITINSEKLSKANAHIDELIRRHGNDPDFESIVADLKKQRKWTKVEDFLIPYDEAIKTLSSEYQVERDTKLIDNNKVFCTITFNDSYLIEHYTDYKAERVYKHGDEWLDYYNGVCDNASQILDHINLMEGEIILLTPVFKGYNGGWRWHKWGPYIGVHKPQCEYLDDEPEIDHVFCYGVYKLVKSEK